MLPDNIKSIKKGKCYHTTSHLYKTKMENVIRPITHYALKAMKGA